MPLPVEKEPQRLHAFGESTLLQLPVGLVLVNRHYDIQAINPAARRLLGIHGPAVGEDLVHLAQNLPARQLQSTLDAAFHTGTTTIFEAMPVENLPSEEPLYLQILFAPQAHEKPREPVQTVLLVISEVTSLVQSRLQGEEQLRQTKEEMERMLREAAAELTQREEEHVEELERLRREHATERAQREQIYTAELERVRREAAREIASRKEAMAQDQTRFRQEMETALARQETANKRLIETNRQLVEANEELTQSNEGLRTENEELVVRNEEAQAATEEVETLNEELQATSEELETLNEELQSTIEELHTTNDDLQTRNLELQDLARTTQAERAQLAAILLSIDHALLVVNQEGQPVLSNAVLEQLFGSAGAAFVPQDTQGHPLPLTAWPQQRAARGEAFRMEFSYPGPNGQRRWFEARSQPIRGQQDTALGGAIIIQPLPGPSSAPLADHTP